MSLICDSTSTRPFASPKSRVGPAWADDVAARAHSRLAAQHYHGLRAIRCEYDQGILILRGVVGSFYLKQLALAAVAGLEGVREVISCIEVHYTPRSHLAFNVNG